MSCLVTPSLAPRCPQQRRCRGTPSDRARWRVGLIASRERSWKRSFCAPACPQHQDSQLGSRSTTPPDQSKQAGRPPSTSDESNARLLGGNFSHAAASHRRYPTLCVVCACVLARSLALPPFSARDELLILGNFLPSPVMIDVIVMILDTSTKSWPVGRQAKHAADPRRLSIEHIAAVTSQARGVPALLCGCVAAHKKATMRALQRGLPNLLRRKPVLRQFQCLPAVSVRASPKLLPWRARIVPALSSNHASERLWAVCVLLTEQAQQAWSTAALTACTRTPDGSHSVAMRRSLARLYSVSAAGKPLPKRSVEGALWARHEACSCYGGPFTIVLHTGHTGVPSLSALWSEAFGATLTTLNSKVPKGAVLRLRGGHRASGIADALLAAQDSAVSLMKRTATSKPRRLTASAAQKMGRRTGTQVPAADRVVAGMVMVVVEVVAGQRI